MLPNLNTLRTFLYEHWMHVPNVFQTFRKIRNLSIV